MKREKRREQKARERWRGGEVNGLIQRSGSARPEGDPLRSCLSAASRSGLQAQKQDCWQENLLLSFNSFTSFSFLFVVASPSPSCTFPSIYLPNSLSTLPSSIGLIPVLIVQAEPLALFKIYIRMLFLYSSKRRHVEPLLNCSANRWRFSRCLYEIKWNIPIKKRHFPLSLHPPLSHFLCLTLLFLSFFFSVFVSVFSTFTSFFSGLPQAWARARCLKWSGK